MRQRQPRWIRATLIGAAAGTLMLGGMAAPAGAVPDDPNLAIADDGVVSAPVAPGGPEGASSFEGTDISEGNGASYKEDPTLIGPSIAPGGIGTQSVIMPDGRVRVNPTTSFPARATVYLTRRLNGVDSPWCTGWMFGSNLVVTAGHCVHAGGGGSWYPVAQFRAWPGRNGTAAPYGSCTARRLHSVIGWTQLGDERYDYGAIKLNCTIGNTVGWYGAWWQTATLTGLATTVSGYPADRPAGEQWRHSDRVRVTQERQVFYQNDTFNGQSGGPVYQLRPSGSPFCVGHCSMGIHGWGLHLSPPHSTNNHGARIVQPVFANLMNWRTAA